MLQNLIAAIVGLLGTLDCLLLHQHLTEYHRKQRRWERSAREALSICNQAASFNRCLLKVQQNMKDQLKVLKAENHGKGSTKGSTAIDELHYLMDFNSSITQAAVKSMEHLSEFIFISMGNLTLVRRDAYLSHLRTGIKPDTLTSKEQRKTLLSLKQKDTLDLHITRVATTHMSVSTKGRSPKIQGWISRPGKLLEGNSPGEGKVALSLTHHDQPRASSRINDNFCVTKLQA